MTHDETLNRHALERRLAIVEKERDDAAEKHRRIYFAHKMAARNAVKYRAKAKEAKAVLTEVMKQTRLADISLRPIVLERARKLLAR